jgi:alpha-glucosidase (family GH31 glycosyl hydrolase)
MTEDTWINSLYAKRNRGRGSRWPVFSRIGASYWAYFGDQEPGAFAEHRQTIHFTGDARATWQMLDFESRLTAAEGAGIGLPYVSHDIGSFKGRHLDDDMYVRWVQFGAFQPINRLHSDHGDRLPWQYTGKARAVAARFLRLRGSLVPYLYTLARRAHDSGLPIVRAMYLQWPEREGAYRRDRQYMLGRDLLVAPVAKPGDPGRKTVWFPPGTWVDFFTGERHIGPRVEQLSVPLDRMPVFARAGAIVPSQDYAPHQPKRPPERLTLTVWGGGGGKFRLYEDAGDGTAYRRGAFAFTRIKHRGNAVTIGAARGHFAGQRAKRRWRLRLVGAPRPGGVTVNGRAVAFRYDAATRTAVVTTGRLSTARPVHVTLNPS